MANELTVEYRITSGDANIVLSHAEAHGLYQALSAVFHPERTAERREAVPQVKRRRRRTAGLPNGADAVQAS